VIPTFLPAGLILSRNHGLATFVHERLEWSLVDQSPEQSETEWLCADVAGYKIINIYNLHARDSLQRPSRRSHTPVCILATSTASMSTGVTTQHPLTVRAWTPGQHPAILDTSAPTRMWPSRILARTADCRTDVSLESSRGHDIGPSS